MSDLELQEEEIQVLSSIYGEDFIPSEKHLLSSTEAGLDDWFSVKVSLETVDKRFFFKFRYPIGYPSHSKPEISFESDWLTISQIAILKQALDDLYIQQGAGDVIVFKWVEWLRAETVQFMGLQSTLDVKESQEDMQNLEKQLSICEIDDFSDTFSTQFVPNITRPIESEVPKVFHGDILTDRKSHFQAHAAQVDSLVKVRQVVDYLKGFPKIARATHNVMVYRFFDASGRLNSDFDDDGEAGAGANMLELLQLINAQNVVVVVSRWYGGIQLGPDRFKHFRSCTSELLDSLSWTERSSADAKKHTQNKSRKK